MARRTSIGLDFGDRVSDRLRLGDATIALLRGGRTDARAGRIPLRPRMVGDAGIMVAAYLLGSIGNSYSPWLVHWPAGRFNAYLATGLVITASVEVLAVGADWGWTYSDLMPLLPGTHIGLVPMLMWVIVPTATLWLVRRIGVGPKEHLPNN